MSIQIRRGYSYIPRLVDNVDRAAAEGKNRVIWKLFDQTRPHSSYVRSGILGSGVKKAMAMMKRMGL